MTDIDIRIPQDDEIVEIVNDIPWREYIDHGTVTIQIRNGKVGLTRIERTHID